MTDISREQALAHFGVKGMKWGVRNQPATSSNTSPKKLMKDFDADIAKAHEEETRWMLKNVPSFNPLDNPYLPEYELQRLRGG